MKYAFLSIFILANAFAGLNCTLSVGRETAPLALEIQKDNEVSNYTASLGQYLGSVALLEPGKAAVVLRDNKTQNVILAKDLDPKSISLTLMNSSTGEGASLTCN